MAHSLMTPPVVSPSPISVRTVAEISRWSCDQGCIEMQSGKARANLLNRRALVYGLVGTGIALTMIPENAKAAQRRPPATPPVEKKDPNMSALQAKILASKKRKEAMQEEIAKLKEKGKPVI